MRLKEFLSNTRFIWLIAVSLLLLAAFQVFWLRKVWDEQKEAFIQEADNIFQRTVIALQDSLTHRAIRRNGISPDTFFMPLPPPMLEVSGLRTMRLREKKRTIMTRDSSSVELKLKKQDRSDQVQIFVSTLESNDGPPNMPGLDRIMANWENKRDENGKRFVFKVEQDTMDENELRFHYTDRLQKAGLPADFQLLKFEDFGYPDSGLLATEPMHAGLLTHRSYAACFPDYQPYILKKTLPFGFFSLLLFGITAAAFWVIWKSLRRQQRLTKLKNDFIANITHELKTPITTVSVALEALSDFDARRDPVRTREYLDISKLELERLSLLVDKVLRLSMFEQQEPRLRMETLSLAEVVQQVLGALRLQAERRGAVIDLDFDPALDYAVKSDRLHLSSVVFNLLDNALKYTKGEAHVRVALRKEGDLVSLSVQDNGPGIPSDYRDKIFEKFFRLPTAGDTHDVKGHGLGLSYARQVARLHGGDITLSSTEHEGSTFVLSLPAADSIAA
ncbi:MAG: HAMP domain-containing histidine kinase [Saprospiraceae bacterium]|nr:HAMP domain-containing histidine kinase [Saprospiraceae bacterium]